MHKWLFLETIYDIARCTLGYTFTILIEVVEFHNSMKLLLKQLSSSWNAFYHRYANFYRQWPLQARKLQYVSIYSVGSPIFATENAVILQYLLSYKSYSLF